MQTTGTNVKFSPGRELYPGTQDRVCVIVGCVGSIVSALKSIYRKIGESDRLKTDSLDTLRQLKMLISNIASGMVIGKSGQTVKSIQLDCAVRIQISSKEDAGGLPERVLTVQGETDNILSAARMVLERIINDPEADKWKRMLSYSGYTTSQSHASGIPSLASSSSSSSAANAASSNSHTDYSSLSSFFQSMVHPAYSNMANFQSAAAAAATASSNPSSHSFTHGADTMGSASSLSQAMFTYMYAQSLMTNSAYFSRYSPAVVDGVNMSIPGATLATFEIAIPEVMISAVLGPGGKLISDLIQTTGTHVQLSQKGDYIPGTYNRKLTITGPILGVQSAHLMVMQSIVREQEAFRKQGLI